VTCGAAVVDAAGGRVALPASGRRVTCTHRRDHRAQRQRARDPEFSGPSTASTGPMVERSLVLAGRRREQAAALPAENETNNQWLHHTASPGSTCAAMLATRADRTASTWTIPPADTRPCPTVLTKTTTSATLIRGRVNSLSRSSGDAADPHGRTTDLRGPCPSPTHNRGPIQERHRPPPRFQHPTYTCAVSTSPAGATCTDHESEQQRSSPRWSRAPGAAPYLVIIFRFRRGGPRRTIATSRWHAHGA